MLEAIPSTITHIKTVNKSIRIHVDTQEALTPDTVANIYGLKDKLGWFFFAEQKEKLPSVVDTSKLPEIHVEEGEKSPSQRLRAVLYVYWQQKGSKDDFELFYKRWMERTINAIKEQLT